MIEQSNTIIRVEGLTKAYPGATPIKDMSFRVDKGESIVIIGPSGTGKSTLLRMLNMLDVPTEGSIYIDGQDITQRGCRLDQIRQKVGMVFQSYTLFNHMTVVENLMDAPMQLLGRSWQEAYDRAMAELDHVRMAEHALKYPDELSGGQRQRVAIARALCMDPEVILFDEPTSALDPTMVSEVEAVLKELSKKGVTMMTVTHEMRLAKELASRVFFLTDGVVYEDGTPEQIFRHPQKEATRVFVQRLRTWRWHVTRRRFDLDEVMMDLEEFGQKSSVSPRTIRSSQSCFEEMIAQIIMPQITGEPDLLVEMEYSGEAETMRMRIYYHGDAVDLERCENDLALKLLYAQILSMEQTSRQADEALPYENLMELRLKTGGEQHA